MVVLIMMNEIALVRRSFSNHKDKAPTNLNKTSISYFVKMQNWKITIHFNFLVMRPIVVYTSVKLIDNGKLPLSIELSEINDD